MGNAPLQENREIAEIKDWLERAGVKRIFELPKWNHRGDWEGWDFHGVPDRLSHQQAQLEDLLDEAAPVHKAARDCWGWGPTGLYSTALGYRELQGNRNSNYNAEIWKIVWDTFATPKVNFFIWTVIHNKILTGDNLEKRNIAGPHRCAMCNNSSETVQHLLIGCSVAKDVWRFILMDLQITVPTFNSAADLFASWRQLYPHHIPQKSFWSRIWTALPKYVCWQIWLSRNHLIFNEERHSPMKIAAKAKAFLMEVANQQYIKEDTTLLQEEKIWLGDIVPHPGRNPPIPQNGKPGWRLREEEEIFQSWWRSQNIHTIFFDGASKGNPGAAGAGGVLYTTDGLSKDFFFWGLGKKTNNQAELFGLLKACQIARGKGVQNLQVFGDSELIIKNLNKGARFNNPSLNNIADRLKRVLQEFDSCKFYHILRKLNSEADQMANKGSELMKGLIFVNNDSYIQMP